MEIVSVITWVLVLFAGDTSDVRTGLESRPACEQSARDAITREPTRYSKWRCYPVMSQKIVAQDQLP